MSQYTKEELFVLFRVLNTPMIWKRAGYYENDNFYLKRIGGDVWKLGYRGDGTALSIRPDIAALITDFSIELVFPG